MITFPGSLTCSGELGSWSDLEGWLGLYEDGITRLVKDFGDSLREDRVLGIVPFTPVFKTLLTGEPTLQIRCGAGVTSFAVMTNGRIDVCPIAPELPYNNVGDIRTSTPDKLLNIQPVEDPCTTCDVLGVCGGRCLFSNKTMFWGREWSNRVYDTTRHMIRELEKQVPLARQMIEGGVLDAGAFDYLEINNGCEIIP